jgi:hypothetical protein
MIEAGLSPYKYVIRVSSLNMDVDVRTHHGFERGAAGEYTTVNREIFVGLFVTIEDITTLQPGQPQALQARYHFLCSGDNIAATEELRQWAKDIGFPRADISNHYGFL